MAPVVALVLAALMATQATLLQIRLVEGEDAVYAAGSRGPGLTVEITDEVGRPVSGGVVSLKLPDDGPSGVFANGMATEILVTGSDGRATTTPIRWNRIPGAVQIRVTAVRDRLRAGTVITQNLSDPGTKIPVPDEPSVARSSGRSKWMKIALIAAGAAGIGFATGMAARGGDKSASAAAPAPVQIGPPTITLSKR